MLPLALGIGANTAIFTLLDQILLRLLPVKNPQQLALLTIRGMEYGNNSGGNAMSYPLYRDFSERNAVFTGVFCRFAYAMSLSFNGRTERVDGELVSGTFFRCSASAHPWDARSRLKTIAFLVIGKAITVNAHNFTVIGVAQRDFNGVESRTHPAGGPFIHKQDAGSMLYCQYICLSLARV